jgi:hypothetical protein
VPVEQSEYSQRRVTSVEVTVETEQLVFRTGITTPFDDGGSREVTLARSEIQDEQFDIKNIKENVRSDPE